MNKPVLLISLVGLVAGLLMGPGGIGSGTILGPFLMLLGIPRRW